MLAVGVLEERYDIVVDGVWSCDACGCGLTVDWLVSTAKGDEIAIEVTSLVDRRHHETFRAASKHRRRFHGVAPPGRWTVAVSDHARIQPSEKDILLVMNRMAEVGQHEFYVTHYTSDDLLAAEAAQPGGAAALQRRRGELHRAGLESISWAPALPNEVHFMVLSSYGQIGSFVEPLTRAMHANAEKLAAARPRQTVLAVDVLRFDASTWQASTPPPDFPDRSIDLVIVAHAQMPYGGVWAAARGERTWWESRTLRAAGPP